MVGDADGIGVLPPSPRSISAATSSTLLELQWLMGLVGYHLVIRFRLRGTGTQQDWHATITISKA
jgi:hypothetical protein